MPTFFDAETSDAQIEKFARFGFSARKIGVEIGRLDMGDSEIFTLLHGFRQSTFITRDSDFYRKANRHARYGLVFLDTPHAEVANHARRLFRHQQFDTAAKRCGKVIRVTPTKVHWFELGNEAEQAVDS